MQDLEAIKDQIASISRELSERITTQWSYDEDDYREFLTDINA